MATIKKKKYSDNSNFYTENFANFWDSTQSWGPDANALNLCRYYEQIVSNGNKTLLDIGCGTGNFALYFLQKSYTVTGLDLSEEMLRHARKKTESFIKNGKAKFIQGDARYFKFNTKFALATCFGWCLNHLDGEEDLENLFRSTFNAVEEGGYFFFNFLTEKGFANRNYVRTSDSEKQSSTECWLYHPETEKVSHKFSGFIQSSLGKYYVRFQQTLTLNFHKSITIKRLLSKTGWKEIYFSLPYKPSNPIPSTDEVTPCAWCVAKK